MKRMFFLCSLVGLNIFFMQAFAIEKLIFSVDLIRHGDRTPQQDIPKSPYSWPEGLGKLTATGMHQEFALGATLRKKYIDQYHLLPKQYNADIMYVRSTDFDRTLMSAQSFLLGLYPQGTGSVLPSSKQFALPQGFQPIPIHTIPIKQDKLLTVEANYNIFSNIYLYLTAHKVWKNNLNTLKDKLQVWSQATGMQLNNFRQLIYLADNLHIRKLHHIALPKGITQSDANEIISMGEAAMVAQYQRKTITHGMGHRFLTTIAQDMQEVINHQSPLKYILFSAHDSSIMAVMVTLGAPLNKVPHYASHLNFSLWEKDKQYYIKVSLNDQPVLISSCGDHCTFSQFKQKFDL